MLRTILRRGATLAAVGGFAGMAALAAAAPASASQHYGGLSGHHGRTGSINYAENRPQDFKQLDANVFSPTIVKDSFNRTTKFDETPFTIFNHNNRRNFDNDHFDGNRNNGGDDFDGLVVIGCTPINAAL